MGMRYFGACSIKYLNYRYKLGIFMELVAIKLSIVFLFAITISFLNVCIYRIPRGEGHRPHQFHCMNCGYKLAWYDLIPIFSWIFLRGRCRKCGEKISVQYPLIELANGLLWVGLIYKTVLQ